MSNILSMSLYGDALMYLQGAIENARLAPVIYPGWKMVVYCEKGIDTTELKALGCEIRMKPASLGHSGMFWRFLAAWDEDTDLVIFRDVDSRLNVREAAAVKVWDQSGMLAHSMHDHRHHSQFPFLGGMWGIEAGVLPRNVFDIVDKMSQIKQRRVDDMKFLQRQIHPMIKHSLLRHSSVPMKFPHVPFPEHETYVGFVGQQFDNKGDAVWT